MIKSWIGLGLLICLFSLQIFSSLASHQAHSRRRRGANYDHHHHHHNRHNQQRNFHSRSENSEKLDSSLHHDNHDNQHPANHQSIAVQMNKGQWTKFFETLMTSLKINSPETLPSCLAAVFEKSGIESCSDTANQDVCVDCTKKVLNFFGTNHREIDQACNTLIEKPANDAFDRLLDCAAFNYLDSSCAYNIRLKNSILNSACGDRTKFPQTTDILQKWKQEICPGGPPAVMAEIAKRFLKNYLRYYFKTLDEAKISTISDCLLDKDRIFGYTWVAIIESHLFGTDRAQRRMDNYYEHLGRWVDHIKVSVGPNSLCLSVLTPEIREWFLYKVPEQRGKNDLQEERADKEIAQKIVERILKNAKLEDKTKNQKIIECVVTGDGVKSFPFTTTRLAVASELGSGYTFDDLSHQEVLKWLPEWEALIKKQMSSECTKKVVSSNEVSAVENEVKQMIKVVESNMKLEWPEIWRFHSKEKK
jgi:hypothetical protein